MPYKDKAKQRACQYRLMVEKRQIWLAENGPCAFCGSWDRLEVDHVDPAQKVEHKVWTWSKERRDAELAKCRTLCHDCHKSHSRQQQIDDRAPQIHGTWQSYKRPSAPCRCGECRAASAAYEHKRRLSMTHLKTVPDTSSILVWSTEGSDPALRGPVPVSTGQVG